MRAKKKKRSIEKRKSKWQKKELGLHDIVMSVHKMHLHVGSRYAAIGREWNG